VRGLKRRSWLRILDDVFEKGDGVDVKLQTMKPPTSFMICFGQDEMPGAMRYFVFVLRE